MRKRVFSRKTLAVLLALSMCLSLLPVSAFAEEPEEAGARACSCSVPCGPDSPNEDCPVCAGDAAACAAAPAPADGEEPSGGAEDPDQTPPADGEEPSGGAGNPDQTPPADAEEPSEEDKVKAPSNSNTEMNVPPPNALRGLGEDGLGQHPGRRDVYNCYDEGGWQQLASPVRHDYKRGAED